LEEVEQEVLDPLQVQELQELILHFQQLQVQVEVVVVVDLPIMLVQEVQVEELEEHLVFLLDQEILRQLVHHKEIQVDLVNNQMEVEAEVVEQEL
jgi:hypothetical protein